MKCKIFKLELQSYIKVLESYKPKIQSRELKLRLNELESEYATFAKELDTADENGTYTRERIEIKYKYIRCRSRAPDLLQPTHITAATEVIANWSKGVTEYSSQLTTHAESARFDYNNLPSV